MNTKKEKRQKRHRRIRAKVKGTAKCPRLAVFKSNQHIYVQLIDDEKGKTIIGLSDDKLKGKKMEIAQKIGEVIAEKALAKKISKVVFDRGGYKYHGRIKAVAESARTKGLKF